MAYRERASHFDVELGGVPPEAVGALIVQNLSVKGFCVLNSGFEEIALDRAVTEAEACTFYQVNDAVAEGLLGAEGSASVADLEIVPETPAEQVGEGGDLRMMDHALTRLGYLLQPHIGLINLSFSVRSAGVVHRVGDMAEVTPELTEAEVSKWQAQFLRHRLMAVLFLGPEAGRLELKPYETQDADPYEVETLPGTLVVLCADSVSHRHFCPGDAYALSAFFLTDLSRRRPPEGGWKLVPAARSLEQWTNQRLSELKELEDRELGIEVPDAWRKAMNHAFHKGQMAGVYGDSVHQTAAYDMDSWIGAASVAPDYAREVSLLRWDHSEYYDTDPESWVFGKTYCRHGNFMDGIEMFDNKFFDLSMEEARELDPHQRLVLEQGYSALARMGMSKKQLGSARGGVYVGCETDEWTAQLQRGFRGIDNQLAMFSGRLSWCLNLKGAAVTVTTEGASSLTAVCMASDSVLARGWQRAAANEFALAIGVSLMLSPTAWTSPSVRGCFSREGRCLTFDSSADGYIRGDGCAAAAVKAATKITEEGLAPRDEKELFLGTVAGAATNHNGRSASLTSPHGPAEQECIARAIRHAGVRPKDVDAVEANAMGSSLRDAVEVSSHRLAHRGAADEKRELLCILAPKSSVGNQVEASGALGLLKAIYSAQWGHVAPLVHLRVTNPYIDTTGEPLLLASEAIGFTGPSSFTGVMSQGLGGTNVYVLTWGTENVEKVSTAPPVTPPEITYWPGGGGEMEAGMLPREKDAYFIVGTWSSWENPQKMERGGAGEYAAVVTLGENGWEQFQIWLDGLPDRVLHPGMPKMQQGSPVFGPDPDFQGGTEAARSGTAPTWIIDGRGGLAGYERGQGLVLRLTDTASRDEETLTEADLETLTWGTTEAGQPGDRYEVLLQVRGKWRAVTWRKLETAERPALPAGSAGAYYLAGAWSDWALEEMRRDPWAPGLFAVDVLLPATGIGDFQIVRDKDWCQAFYPNPEAESLDDPDSVLGPDDLGFELSWWRIEGVPGERFRVHFHRAFGEDGAESRHVSWRRVEAEAEAPAHAEALAAEGPASAEAGAVTEDPWQPTATGAGW